MVMDLYKGRFNNKTASIAHEFNSSIEWIINSIEWI